MSSSIEKCMVEVMHFLSDAFPNQAILKGGMELRLMDCPRFTNDLDYIFIPYELKKNAAEILMNALSQFPDAKIKSTVHSTCIRFLIEKDTTTIQLEVNVAMTCKSEPVSTSSLAVKNGFLPRVIRAMSLPVALSHKLAAWNERGLIRDLYDMTFLTNILGIKLDPGTLYDRLQNVHYRYKMKFQKNQMPISVFIAKLTSASQKLTQDAIDKELKDYLSKEELPGLDKKIKVAINTIAGDLESMFPI
jgi:hypothetical protein